TVTPSAVSVTIVHEIVDEIRSLLPNKASVELISEVDDQLPAMYTDELRFKQILYNLLDNAVHHTTQGQIKIIAEVLDNHMVIHVMDTGSGIPPQEQDYIFHSFYRGNNKKKGLGLGLAIAKNMVEKLNGSIH